MTGDEAVRLIAVTRAAFPGMNVVEGQGQVWHSGLGDLSYAECAAAVVEYAKTSAQIPSLADIRSRVASARRAVAGEERQHELEAQRPAWASQERKPMPDWFRSTMEEHRRRARAERKQAEDAGSPVTFGSMIVSTVDGMRKPEGWT